MQLIHVLDDSLISKIAAGEVIERPMSVVKELVENSIDAKANNIIITIEGGGFNLIKIEDNGVGMSKDDAEVCLLRHATSKIKNVDDLFNINTLGFRGEALASIASVSLTTVITKQKNDKEGTRIISDGKSQKIESVGTKDGTTIMIENLFYNTPVRKKFLKNEEKEFKEILEFVTNFALFYHEVSFKLTNEGKVVFESSKSSHPLQVLIDVFGKSVAKDMLEISSTKGPIKISGFISKPSLTRSSKDNQIIFVNGRIIKDKTVTEAIYDAYHTLLFNNRHPILVLKIEIDPTLIDVNVHPKKKEIRIENEKQLYDSIYHAIKDALDRNNLVEELSKPKKHESDEQSKLEVEKYLIKDVAQTYDSSLEPRYQFSDKVADSSSQSILTSDLKDFKNEKVFESTTEDIAKIDEQKVEKREFAFKIFGQYNKCFILVEMDNELLIVDQHTAEERIIYDTLMRQYEGKGIAKQVLLRPMVMDLDRVQSAVMSQNIEILNGMGFDISHFGDNSFSVRCMPVVFSKQQNQETVLDILDELRQNSQIAKSKKLDNLKESIITRMACRSAVKRGDYLTIVQMNDLIDKLLNSTLPNTCPHGRPIFINVTKDELEKRFKRK